VRAEDRIDTGRSRPLRWWDAGVAATVAVMAGIGIVELLDERAASAFEMLSVFGPLALLLAWYLLLGRTALRRATLELPLRPVDLCYLGGLVLMVGLAAAAVPSYATLQAIAYPMIWTIVARYRDAVIWSAALALAVGVGFVGGFSKAGRIEGLGEATAVVLLSFAFAVVMGTWITRIFAQGERYRELAEQLRRSQEEVAALSQEAGAAAERERLSRELHDTLTQTLTGLLMLGEQADRALAAGDVERARERMGRVQAASRAAVEEARALVAATHPLGDGGLEQAIERVAAGLREDAELSVRCELEPLPLDRERQVVVLRAVQEGLSNVRRHARAEEAVVSLRRDGSDALLTIEDDGAGPQAAAQGQDASGRSDGSSAPPTGFGLDGLRDRVRLVGGEMRFEPREGGGSRLSVRVPLAAAVREGGGE